MSPTVRDFIIGLCTIIALIGLSILLIRFGEIRTTSQYEIQIPSLTANGLRAGSSVTLNGVKVGSIEGVHVSNDPRWPVLVIAGIDETHLVPTTAEPFATSSLLGTGASLELLVEPSATVAPTYPTDGTARMDGPIRNLMLTRLNEALDERLKPVLSSVEELSATYNELGQGVLAMIGETSLEGPTIQTTLARVNGALELVEAWIGDPKLREDMHDLLGTSVIFVNKGIDMVEEMTVLARNIDVQSQALVDELVPVASELSRLLDTSRRLVKEIHDGDGTLGQLVRNPDLYNSLEASMTQLQEAIISFKLLVDQLREEGVF